MAGDLSNVPTADLLTAATTAKDNAEFGRLVAELIERHRVLVYRKVLLLCRNDRALADDVFQDTFIRLFRWLRSRRERPLHSFPRLLSRFAQRAAVDLMRKRRLPVLRSGHAQAGIDDQLYARELMELLDERSREVLKLSFFDELGSAEIARRLRLSAGNVRQIRFRALEAMRLQRLRDQIADQFEPL